MHKTRVDCREWLEAHAEEWAFFEQSFRIPISRFYCDYGVFDRLREIVIPALASRAVGRGERTLVATDAEPHMLERARVAVYQFSALKDLLPSWRESAFAK